MAGVKANLVGQRFGRLVVLRKLPNKNTSGKVCWESLCDCGNVTASHTQNYRSGQKLSCGCLFRETRRGAVVNVRDLSGERFGRWRVIARVKGSTASRNARWKCKCECGSSRVVPGGHLTSGTSTSCGCWVRKKNTTHGLSRTPAYANFLTAKRNAAKTQRTPRWADMEAIREFYRGCPKGMHVDHIVPLRATLASGLHVRENLQYLPQSKNTSKQNKFKPEFIKTTDIR